MLREITQTARGGLQTTLIYICTLPRKFMMRKFVNALPEQHTYGVQCSVTRWRSIIYTMLVLTAQKATTHQVTTMLATSTNVLFPGHNHWYWWSDTLIIAWLLPESSTVNYKPYVQFCSSCIQSKKFTLSEVTITHRENLLHDSLIFK